MKMRTMAQALLLACGASLMAGCQLPGGNERGGNSGRGATATTLSLADPDIASFIQKIRAVDNHSHANSVAPGDSDQDALPLEAIFPFEVPVRMRPDVNPDWMNAYKALYKYQYDDMSDAHMGELRAAMQGISKEQGDKFPTWVLDQVGTEVLFANRIAMGPGLVPPRFRWVSYVDALMLPLSTKAEAATSPDREQLFPFEDKLLRRYLADLNLSKPPATLDGYLKSVVTPTLEAQQQGGCIAVKFEAAFLRALDFEEVSPEAAAKVYSRYVNGGEPSHVEYKLLQDFLFYYIAREAGRLSMAVHIHSFAGPGNFYRAAGADPLLLESVFNSPDLRKTNFVLIHGGGIYSPHTSAMLWKPNVYADISALTLIYPPARLAEVLRDWLTQFPEKVLFGSDAAAFGPDAGWELGAWIATKTGREALALALTDMIRAREVDRERAEEIATMVMRTNANRLYGLGLN